MPSDYDTSALRSFAAAARAGSISRAAAALGRSQPALSQQLRRLEATVGRALLARTPRGIRLTLDGELLLPYAERMLALHDEAQAQLQARLAVGRRSIGLLEDLTSGRLAESLADFASLHPRLVLEIIVAPGPHMQELVGAGRLDMVLGDPAHMTGPLPHWKVQRRLAWVATPSFDWTADPLPLVLFSPPCRWREPVLATLNQAARRWRCVFESTSLHAVQSAVQAGLGAAALLPGTLPPGMLPVRDDTHQLPPAPLVELGLCRRHGVESDSPLDALESLLRRLV